jgi:hypothetical protein
VFCRRLSVVFFFFVWLLYCTSGIFWYLQTFRIAIQIFFYLIISGSTDQMFWSMQGVYTYLDFSLKYVCKSKYQKELGYTKRVIRIRKSKKGIQDNGQKTKDKRTNNYLQYTTLKTKRSSNTNPTMHRLNIKNKIYYIWLLVFDATFSNILAIFVDWKKSRKKQSTNY